MPNIAENLWDATRGSSLYCVWVPMRDGEGYQLVSIWIDPAMTAFKSRARETSASIETNATRCAGPEGEVVDLFAEERATSILPRRG
jgi:hypothetical protein